jgi:hypothetical protein
VVQGGASVWLGLCLVAVVSACGGLSGSTNDTGGSAARAGATTGGSSTTGGTGGSSTSGGSGGGVSAGGAGGSAATSGASMGGSGGSGGSIDTGGLPPCLQPRDSGPCDAALTRFAFDPETLTCVPFAYGGCAGNANRFETLEACEAACVAPLAPECADARRGDGCPCTQHEQCDGACSSVPFEQGEGCAPSSVGYCADVTEGNCACRFDTGEGACGV